MNNFEPSLEKEKIYWKVKFLDEYRVLSTLYNEYTDTPVFQFTYDTRDNQVFLVSDKLSFKYRISPDRFLTYVILIKENKEFKYATDYRDFIKNTYIQSYSKRRNSYDY